MAERAVGSTASRLYVERIKDGILYRIPDLFTLSGTRYDYIERDGVDGNDDASASDYFVAIQVNAFRFDGRLGIDRRHVAGQF